MSSAENSGVDLDSTGCGRPLCFGVRMNIRDDAPATGKAMNSKKPCLVLSYETLAQSLLWVAYLLQDEAPDHVAKILALATSMAIPQCAADIAGKVAAMTEDDQGVASERIFHNTLGWPGQRSEAGKAFGGLV